MATDLGKVGMRTRGDWSSSATYEVLDAVTYNNGLYIAKQAVPANTTPTNTTYWQAAVVPVSSIKFDLTKVSEDQTTFVGYGIFHPLTKTVSIYVASNSSTSISETTVATGIPVEYRPSTTISLVGFWNDTISNTLSVNSSGNVSQASSGSFQKILAIGEYTIT